MQKLQHYTVGLLVIIAGMTVIQLNPQWHNLLAYNSSTVLSEGWPLITGHLVHLSFSHLLFNALALVVIVIVWRELFTTRWLINALLISAASVSLLLLLLPWTIEFVGLSAVLHGLLMYALLRDVKQHKWLWLVVAGLLAKVIAELLGWRPDHFVGPAVSYAHAAGLLSSLVLLKLEQRRLRDAAPNA